MRRLKELALGDRATVSKVGGERHVRRRLLEMGVLPGTELRVVRRAPMGDPIEVRLRGYSLSIRGSEAAAIDVRVQPTSQPARSNSEKDAALSPAE